MPRKTPFARIAITLPQETLRAADELASRHDRSRSWIVAEAIRQYAAGQRRETASADPIARLGASRAGQLRRDAAMTPEARVLESEEIVAIGEATEGLSTPLAFPSYDAFLAWRRDRDGA